MIRIVSALAFSLLAIEPAVAADASFDCATARTRVEKAICADAELAGLDQVLASRYREAMARIEGQAPLVAKLKQEQRKFLDLREAALDDPKASLAQYMMGWRDWLDAVGEPRTAWSGTWVHGSGSLQIGSLPDGRYTVVVKADDAWGSYTCEFIGLGRAKGNRIEVTWDIRNDEEDGAMGWTLVLQRRGGLIKLREHRNASEAETRPYCGSRGGLEGAYLPARRVPEAVTVWRPEPADKGDSLRP